jgi:uncharacterized protein YjbJ (UPF0337 family)
MSTDDKSKKMADEYGKKAKEAMDRVTDDQPPEVKERVDKVQNAVEKTIDSTKDAVS